MRCFWQEVDVQYSGLVPHSVVDGMVGRQCVVLFVTPTVDCLTALFLHYFTGDHSK